MSAVMDGHCKLAREPILAVTARAAALPLRTTKRAGPSVQMNTTTVLLRQRLS